MLELFEQFSLVEESKRTPQDRFSGDNNNKTFLFYYLTPSILQRVYLDGVITTSGMDFYTFLFGTSYYLYFYNPPPLGTNNIVCHSDNDLHFPGGTTHSGALNAFRGESVDTPYYISNNNSAKRYDAVTVTPFDFIDPDESSWVKLALTEAGLDSAVAGAALEVGEVNDTDTPHVFWSRITVPPRILGANVPNLNKYDIYFSLSYAEETL